MHTASFIMAMLLLVAALGMALGTGINMAALGQLSYEDQSALPGLEGGLASTGYVDIHSRTPGADVAQVDTIVVTTVIAEVAQVETLTITTAADADAFTVWIDGVIVATGTSAGTDKTVQRDALEVLLEANAYFAANFVWADSSTDAGTITAVDPSRSFTLAVDITATSVWTRTTTTPYVAGTQFELTVDGHVLRYGAAGTTEETESDAFLALILADASISALVTATEGTDANILLTAVTPGVPFTATLFNRNESGVVGSGTISMSTTTANVTGEDIPFGRAMTRTTTAGQAVLPSATGFVLEGISLNRAHGQPKEGDVTGEAFWAAGEVVPVLRRGIVYVRPETTGLLTASVYVRHTQGADPTHTVGRFRATDDSAKVDAYTATQGLRWLDVPTAGVLCRLEVNLP